MSSPLTISRRLNLQELVEKKSHFLLGPRQTGKSFLIAHSVKGARVYDLLDSAVYLALSQRPQRLAEELSAKDRIAVIDEIQRLPTLLNEVHRLIEQRGTRFLLTGSSARKLRQGGVNLLGGRARTKYLHPLTSRELGDHFDLDRFMARGGLPSIYFSDDPQADRIQKIPSASEGGQAPVEANQVAAVLIKGAVYGIAVKTGRPRLYCPPPTAHCPLRRCPTSASPSGSAPAAA